MSEVRVHAPSAVPRRVPPLPSNADGGFAPLLLDLMAGRVIPEEEPPPQHEGPPVKGCAEPPASGGGEEATAQAPPDAAQAPARPRPPLRSGDPASLPPNASSLASAELATRGDPRLETQRALDARLSAGRTPPRAAPEDEAPAPPPAEGPPRRATAPAGERAPVATPTPAPERSPPRPTPVPDAPAPPPPARAEAAAASAVPAPAPPGAGPASPAREVALPATAAVGTRAAPPPSPVRATGAPVAQRAPAIVAGARGAALSPRQHAAPSAPAPRAARPDFASQVDRGLAAVLLQKGGTLTLRLSPEAMGSIRIRLRITEGRVDATLEASRGEARRLLGSNIESLRRSLESRGLAVERLEIGTLDSPRSAPLAPEQSPGGSGQSGAEDPPPGEAEDRREHTPSEGSRGGSSPAEPASEPDAPAEVLTSLGLDAIA